MKSRKIICLLTLAAVLVLSSSLAANELRFAEAPGGTTDDRPPLTLNRHNLGNLWSAFLNCGLIGSPWGNHPSMEWPGGQSSNYLWCADVWSCCYGDVTTQTDSTDYWASCSDYGDWELQPSDGFPVEKLTPGPVADEESHCGYDDWDIEYNANPYGIRVYQQLYSWTDDRYDDFIMADFTITHHSSYGSGEPLDGFVMGIKSDCDVATADVTECHMDDMVYYDGHAIWCNDPNATFEYEFDDGTLASQQDDYTYQQNPDSPFSSSDPENIYYYYNYLGSDGTPDNDVNGDGVSDHFTILVKVAGGDTLFRQDPSGNVLFSSAPEGYSSGPTGGAQQFGAILPSGFWEHTVGDTTYLVTPRNMSYMWDGDINSTGFDDSGEQTLYPPCNGYIGWRLLDAWIVKANGTLERPFDVYNCPIPISHTWWNWEGDPGTDPEKYRYMWGINPDMVGLRSGPAYMANWIGNPNAPLAEDPDNPGPFPFVNDSPLNMGCPVFDYRYLQSVGPVDLADGDSLHVIGGWVVGRGLDGLRMNADLMLDAYCRYLMDEGASIAENASNTKPSSDMIITPNPARTNQISIAVDCSDNSLTGLNIYDMSGRVVLEFSADEISVGDNLLSFEIGSLEQGIYIVQLTTETGFNTEKIVKLR